MNDNRPTYLLFFIGLLPFIMVIGNSMFIPMLPQMQTDMGLTTVEGGWLLTSFSIPAALLVPFGGILSDRYGRKKIALIALPFIIVGCVISAIAGMKGGESSSFQIMMVGRVFQGIGAGGATPLAMAFISDLYQGEQRNRALGAIEVFNGAGKVISPIVGGLVLAVSWYVSFVIYLAVALFAFVGIKLFITTDPVIKKDFENRNEKTERLKRQFVYHWRWLIPILASGTIGMFLLFGYLFYFSYLLESTLLVSDFLNGMLLALPLFVLTILSYSTAKRLRSNENQYKRAFIYGIMLMIGGTLLMLIDHSLSLFVCAIIIYSFGFGMLLPAANAALASIVLKKERGTVFSFYTMLRFLGVALGPLCFGIWMRDIEQMMFTALFFISLNGLILVYSWKCFPIGKECNNVEMSRL
ncbi:MFS transporter [Halalkalibacter kiskunsagensis]|uniref:MFS transporter n=1 Tax=Halalkalibacter kiskunsagensis TaxID=1548599 RepID=A0ABV6KJN2_9BACI